MSNFTLPNNQHIPPGNGKFLCIDFIPFYIGSDFLNPELGICFWSIGVFASLMFVPETTVYEDAVLYLGKTISGFPGNLLSFTRKRKPLAKRAFRNANSGLVFFDRILDITCERFSLSQISMCAKILICC